MRRKRVLKTFVMIAVAMCGLAFGAFWMALVLGTPIRMYEGKGYSRLIFDRSGRVLDIQPAPDGRYRSPISLGEVPQACIDAALMYEDRQFYRHPGASPVALVRAALSYGSAHRSGGSTLTMQLVRLRTGINTKTVRGKALQIWDALVLERHASKKDVLEAYFNFAPYGGGIEGIAAASAIYFEKTPKQLTRVECAALAVLPQSPSTRFGFQREGFRNAFGRLVEDLEIPAGERSINFPEMRDIRPVHLARHLTRRVLGQGGAVTTTLDRTLQEQLEETVARYVDSKSELGLKNGAVLVADGRTGDVLAYVGSRNYADVQISGFVDGIAAKRSPGSLLKPFVYAKAIDEGVIVPDSVLTDIPVKLTSYEPENFERNFLGLITARSALVKSRNIPALLLNAQLEEEGLYSLLRTAGVSLPKPADYYGSAVVLGGIEVSLADTVRLYTSFVSNGKAVPLHAVDRGDNGVAIPLYSPEAAYMTREILKQNPPPPGFAPRRTAWKTGTSSGGRDAWAAGIEGSIVVGVWLGNFDNTPNPNFIGRDLAGPLLFDIFERVRNTKGYADLVRNEINTHGLHLTHTLLCAESGLVATDNCPHKKRAVVIPGVSPIKRCTVHRDGGDGTPIYSSEVQAHFRTVGLHFGGNDRRDVDRAEGRISRTPPRIISPEEGIEYRLEYGKDSEIELRADLDGEARKVFWYSGSELIGESKPGESLFWRASPGTTTIRAIDSFGSTDSVTVKVAVQEQ